MTDTIDDKIQKAMEEKQFETAIEEIAKAAVEEYLIRATQEIERKNIDIALQIIEVAKGYSIQAKNYGVQAIGNVAHGAYSIGVEAATEEMWQYARKKDFMKAEEQATRARSYARNLPTGALCLEQEIERAIGFWFDHTNPANKKVVENMFEVVDDINDLLDKENVSFRIGPAYGHYRGEADDVMEIDTGSIGIYTQGKKDDLPTEPIRKAWEEYRIKIDYEKR